MAYNHWSRNFPVFNHAFPQQSLVLITRFFEYPRRGGIPFVNVCVYSHQVEFRESKLAERPERCCGNSPTPARFSQPVAHVGRTPVDITAQLQPDAPDGFRSGGDGKVGLRSLCGSESDPSLGVAKTVRMRETVLQVAPHLSVVGVPGHCFCILRTEAPYLPLAESNLHESISEEIGGDAPSPPWLP